MILGLLAGAPAAQSPPAQQPPPKGQMPDLGRQTKQDDKVPLFDFDAYFPGKWTFEWDMPEGPLGPAGRVEGTTVYSAAGNGVYTRRPKRPGLTASSRSRKRFAISASRRPLSSRRRRQPRDSSTRKRAPSAATSAASTPSTSKARRSRSTANRSALKHAMRLTVAARVSRVDDGVGEGRRVSQLRHSVVEQDEVSDGLGTPLRWSRR